MISEGQRLIVREALACGAFALSPNRESLEDQLTFLATLNDEQIMAFVEPWRIAKIQEINKKLVCMNKKLEILNYVEPVV